MAGHVEQRRQGLGGAQLGQGPGRLPRHRSGAVVEGGDQHRHGALVSQPAEQLNHDVAHLGGGRVHLLEQARHHRGAQAQKIVGRFLALVGVSALELLYVGFGRGLSTAAQPACEAGQKSACRRCNFHLRLLAPMAEIRRPDRGQIPVAAA